MFGLVSAITLFFARAFNFRGRATRAEFWWVQLVFVLVMGIAVARDGQRLIAQAPMLAEDPTLAMAGSMASVWIWIVAFVPMLSLAIRRLHDAGYSGFWYLLQFVPVIGALVLLVICISPSQRDANRWGPPRNPEDPMGYEDAPRVALAPAPEQAGQATPSTSGRKRSAWDGYALILEENQGVCPQREAARKAEISAYYRTRVLKEEPLPAE